MSTQQRQEAAIAFNEARARRPMVEVAGYPLSSGEAPAALTGSAAVDAALVSVCFFTPDAVRDRFTKLIDAYLSDSKPGLPAQERRAALAKIGKQLRETEVAEEKLISELEDAGEAVARRDDFEPEIFFKAHGREGGVARHLAMTDAADEAHAVVRHAIDKHRDAISDRNRRIGLIDAVNADRKIRDDDGNWLVQNDWREREAEIKADHKPDIDRYAAAENRAVAAWEPLARAAAKLRDYARENRLLPPGVS